MSMVSEMLLGGALGVLFSSNKKDNEKVDLKKIDIKQLEALLTASRLAQEPEKYLLREEDLKPFYKDGYIFNDEVINILNNAIDNTSLTRKEVLTILNELKTYKK